LDNRLGPVATVLINTGTLRQGDNFILGSTHGKIKVLFDSAGERLKEASPSMPVRIAGLSKTPLSGDILQVMPSEKAVRQRAKEIGVILDTQRTKKSSALNQLISSVQSNRLLKIVLKADTKGSLEAIKSSLANIKDEEVALKIIHSSVGAINESDIMMASASMGFVVGFHVDFDSGHAKSTAEREGVEVRSYKIIYELLDDVTKLLGGLLEPEVILVELGKAEVLQIFFTKKKEMIVGCKILEGVIPKDAKLRILRGEEMLDEESKMISLQRGENVVDEVAEGEECGIKYGGKIKLQEGDVFEAFKYEEKHRSLGEKIEKPEEEVVEGEEDEAPAEDQDSEEEGEVVETEDSKE